MPRISHPLTWTLHFFALFFVTYFVLSHHSSYFLTSKNHYNRRHPFRSRPTQFTPPADDQKSGHIQRCRVQLTLAGTRGEHQQQINTLRGSCQVCGIGFIASGTRLFSILSISEGASRYFIPGTIHVHCYPSKDSTTGESHKSQLPTMTSHAPVDMNEKADSSHTPIGMYTQLLLHLAPSATLPLVRLSWIHPVYISPTSCNLTLRPLSPHLS